jgi:hypothetical protein
VYTIDVDGLCKQFRTIENRFGDDRDRTSVLGVAQLPGQLLVMLEAMAVGSTAGEVIANSDSPETDPRSLLTVLTTEHFALQAAQGSTVSESSARAALYVGAVSSSLIAIGFIAQASEVGTVFDTFVLVVLPTLYALGVLTFVRLVETTSAHLLYGRAINRIRGYYRELAGREASYLLLSGHDDLRGVLANMGVVRVSRWGLFFTLAAMIAVLNSVVGGTAVAFLAGAVFDRSLGVAAAVGGVVAIASAFAHLQWQRGYHSGAGDSAPAMFPSPS